MNIAVLVLWYLVGYVGCVWALTRHEDVTHATLYRLSVFAFLGPLGVAMIVFCLFDSNTVAIRRRK
jgi:hypothetical protein